MPHSRRKFKIIIKVMKFTFKICMGTLLLKMNVFYPEGAEICLEKSFEFVATNPTETRLTLYQNGHCGMLFSAGVVQSLTFGGRSPQGQLKMEMSEGDMDTSESGPSNSDKHDWLRELAIIATGPQSPLLSRPPGGVFGRSVNCITRVLIMAS